MDFDTALDLSKRCPGSTVIRDEFGLFVVKLPDGQLLRTPQSDPHRQLSPDPQPTPPTVNTKGKNELELEVSRFKRKLADEPEACQKNLKKIDEARKKEQSENVMLRERLEGLNAAAAKQKERQKRLEEKCKSLEKEKEEAQLIIDAYKKRFGRAKLVYATQSIERQVMCPKCEGSGGARGGCRECDGKGWIEGHESEVVPFVQFPDGNS